MAFAQSGPSAPAPPPVPAPRQVAQRFTLEQPRLHIVDGDTVDVDLNGDGILTTPEERLRLLYIDTPEIEANPKGLDRKHGLPARDALERLMRQGQLVILVFKGDERDRYGRMLALVSAGNMQINLAMVELGHTAIDTRFGFPPNYGSYVQAEAKAYRERRGIWGDAPSRTHYLARLRKEGRTPQAEDNGWFLAGVQAVGTLDAARAVGRYVLVEGVVRERRALRKGVWIVTLGDAGRAAGIRTLTAVAFSRKAEQLGLPAWPVAAHVRAEGFLARYKGRIELQLHYARVLPTAGG